VAARFKRRKKELKRQNKMKRKSKRKSDTSRPKKCKDIEKYSKDIDVRSNHHRRKKKTEKEEIPRYTGIRRNRQHLKKRVKGEIIPDNIVSMNDHKNPVEKHSDCLSICSSSRTSFYSSSSSSASSSCSSLVTLVRPIPRRPARVTPGLEPTSAHSFSNDTIIPEVKKPYTPYQNESSIYQIYSSQSHYSPDAPINCCPLSNSSKEVPQMHAQEKEPDLRKYGRMRSPFDVVCSCNGDVQKSSSEDIIENFSLRRMMSCSPVGSCVTWTDAKGATVTEEEGKRAESCDLDDVKVETVIENMPYTSANLSTPQPPTKVFTANSAWKKFSSKEKSSDTTSGQGLTNCYPEIHSGVKAINFSSPISKLLDPCLLNHQIRQWKDDAIYSATLFGNSSDCSNENSPHRKLSDNSYVSSSSSSSSGSVMLPAHVSPGYKFKHIGFNEDTGDDNSIPWEIDDSSLSCHKNDSISQCNNEKTLNEVVMLSQFRKDEVVFNGMYTSEGSDLSGHEMDTMKSVSPFCFTSDQGSSGTINYRSTRNVINEEWSLSVLFDLPLSLSRYMCDWSANRMPNQMKNYLINVQVQKVN